MATVLVVVLVVDGDDDAPTRTCTRARNALLADSRIDGSDSRIGGGGGGGGGARPKGKPKARATGIGTQLLPCTPISDSAAATRMYKEKHSQKNNSEIFRISSAGTIDSTYVHVCIETIFAK